MATSEILTTEDIDALDSVIQLKPHQKDIEFSTVTKSKEGDLVPLDELYEKTGQETIDKIVEGFNSLIRYQKLKKEHGVILNVEGAESWLELPDKMNALKGGEGFIQKLKNGFITIIKKIIAFIKAICSWIYQRLSALLGFDRFEKENEFLYNREIAARNSVIKLFEILNVPITYDELAKDIQDEVYDKVKLMLINQKINNLGETFNNIISAYEDIGRFYKLHEEKSNNIREAQSRYLVIMRNIRAGIAKGTLLQKDIIDLKYVLAYIGDKLLNADEFGNFYVNIVRKVYGVDISGLGVDSFIKNAQEVIKQKSSKIVVEFDYTAYSETLPSIERYYNVRDKFNIPFHKKDIDILKNMIDIKDADIIETAAEMVNDPSVLSVFTTFSTAVRNYAGFTDATLKVIQDAKSMIGSLTNARGRINETITALLEEDIAKIDTISGLEENQKLFLKENHQKLFNFKSLEDQFIEKYPEMKLPAKISNALANEWKTQYGKAIAAGLKKYGQSLRVGRG